MPEISKSSLIIGVILCLLVSTAQSLPIDDLYMAEVLVLSEDEKQLKRGAQAGLLQVLVRISGTRDVEQSREITQSLRNPGAFYYQYSYEPTDKSLLVDGEVVAANLLRILFEPSAVSKLLREAGFPVWGSNRPGVLLWMAYSDEQGRRLLSENDITGSASSLASSLQDQARLRGLPLLFPLLDLEDSAALSTAEVWGSFLGRIDDASDRYNPDSVLTARIQKDKLGRWSANYSYRIDNDWQVAETISYSADQLARTMVDRLANELAIRYAIDSSRSQVTVKVEMVDGIGDYAALASYLESLAPVLNSSIVRVHRSEVEFRLDTEGQNEQLIEIIELDQKMVLLSSDDSRKLLHYRWLRQ
ncbi:MAG: DUF2066 domain-containing protein [Pseudomonadales bacterium]